MTQGSKTARRDALLARRLDLVAGVSALTAEALRLNQKRAGIEMDVLRLELEIGRSGASAQLVRDLHEAEESAAAIMQACAACEDRIVAAEADVEDVDRRLAAAANED
jgi:septal ring factor EnvC (AmiA/AmiB activator)